MNFDEDFPFEIESSDSNLNGNFEIQYYGYYSEN